PPAESDEDEAASSEAALHRHEPERAHHRRIRDLDDAVRSLDELQPEWLSATVLDGLAGAVDVERHLAAEKVSGIQAAENEVRVGHRRLRTAARVAGRPRISTGALRPDAKNAPCIHPSDRAAAGADLD